MPEFYVRYGFNANPFSHRSIDVLAAGALTSQASDKGLLLDIDGFASIGDVGKYLEARQKENKAAFVLVVGNEKAGRSLAALSIMLLERERRGLPPARYLPVAAEAKDHDEVRLFKSWSAALHAKLIPRALSNDVRACLKAARDFADPDTLGYDLQGVIDQLQPGLRAEPQMVMASYFDKIRTEKPIGVAQLAFENTPALCVFTADSSALDLSTYRSPASGVHLLELGHLNAKEAVQVVNARWGPGSKPPFHMDTFGKFCEEREHTIGGVLGIAEQMLINRARSYEKLMPGPLRWPDDPRLGYVTDVETLSFLEAVAYGGG